jgi:hypothetical protein
MELKRLVQQFAYKIEPKPEGGFIARPSDPSISPLEAPTREELQQKIQERLVNSLGERFPALKQKLQEQHLQGKQLKFDVHIERRPDGGFAVHSDQSTTPGATPVEHEKLDYFAERMLNFVAKNVPQVGDTLDAIAESSEVEVFTTKTGTTPNASREFTVQSVETVTTGPGQANSNYPVVTNAPITPEASSLKTFFRLLLAALIIAGLVYLYLHRG